MPGRARHVAGKGLAVVAAVLLGSCAEFVQYTDGLRKSKDRTVLVRGTANLGGVLGVIAGLPADLAALPVTYPFYLYQRSEAPETTDFSSIVLFPSFALLEVCSLLAVPVDLLEYGFYRAWLPPDTMTAQEQEEFEMKLDDETLPRYPVIPIYPEPMRKGAGTTG